MKLASSTNNTTNGYNSDELIGLPTLIDDSLTFLEKLGSSGNTDPYESIYELVYKLTLRTVGCREIAESEELRAKSLSYYEGIEQGLHPSAMLVPSWMPTPAKIKKTASGARLYFLIKSIVDARQREGRTENDPLQYSIDRGDSALKIVEFTMGILLAGQINSGINAAWLLCYLGATPDWLAKARAEVDAILEEHGGGNSTLAEKVKSIPLKVWEEGCPVIDLVFKETIR